MGVALAADSAVTIGAQKVYNTANKIFALSNFHPVAIMIYGNSNFMGVPWETIIKSFRSEIEDERLNTLVEYCEKFLEFVKEDERLVIDAAEDERVREVFNSFLLEVLSKISDLIANESDSPEPGESEVVKIIDMNMTLILEALESEEYLKNYDETFKNDFEERHKSNILEVLNENIYVELPEQTVEIIVKIALNLFSRSVFYESSGVVITGYGEKELFPSLYEFEIAGSYCGRFMYSEKLPIIIASTQDEKNNTTTASIRPFAQKEMVYSFMEGIDPFLSKVLFDSLEDIFIQLPDMLQVAMKKQFSEDEQEQIRKTGFNVIDEFENVLRKVINNRYVEPVMDIVEVLPKEELAAMADALVNLTSFKRKITKDTESVGGPTDVAVISKGDGLIWIKRKHYFKPELNHHFFKNMGRGIQW